MNRTEVRCDDLGAMTLKGLDEAVRLFRARPRDLARDGHERLAALMTDTRGFTQIADVRATPDRADADQRRLEATFAAYDELVFGHAIQHGGLLRYNYADQYLFTFAHPRDALAAARAILEARRSNDVPPETPGIVAAVAYGDLRRISGRYLGSIVTQVLPRLVMAADASTVFASEELAAELAPEVARVVGHGELHQRGRPEPLRYLKLEI